MTISVYTTSTMVNSATGGTTANSILLNSVNSLKNPFAFIDTFDKYSNAPNENISDILESYETLNNGDYFTMPSTDVGSNGSTSKISTTNPNNNYIRDRKIKYATEVHFIKNRYNTPAGVVTIVLQYFGVAKFRSLAILIVEISNYCNKYCKNFQVLQKILQDIKSIAKIVVKIIVIFCAAEIYF